VILADEADKKQIRIHPALQAAGNSNLNVTDAVSASRAKQSHGMQLLEMRGLRRHFATRTDG
jgi:hypothetical protein